MRPHVRGGCISWENLCNLLKRNGPIWHRLGKKPRKINVAPGTRKRLACRVMCTPHGCSAEHPNVSRRSAHPSMRGERSKVANPGRKNAPRERDGLFDIVSCEVRDPRPHPEERACASAPATSNARAHVSKDEDSHGMALMLRDASQRPESAEASVLASGCDAPQHEGEPTCGCGKRSLVLLACFRPVIYREHCNFSVSRCKRAVEAQITSSVLSSVSP